MFGLSTQPTDYQQRDSLKRLEVPFELVSDVDFEFAEALSLPTFETGGVTYLKRLTLCLNDGCIERVYYPIVLPAAHAREVCAYLGMTHRSDAQP